MNEAPSTLMNKSNICLVEPNHSHEEVLYPWIELLNHQYEVYIVAPKSLFEVDLLRETREYYHPVPYVKGLPKSRIWRIIGIFQKYITIKKTVDQINPTVVLFNSVPTLFDALLIAFIFRRYRKLQVIHDVQNYLSPLGRFLYGAFDGNIVLSEEICNYVKVHHPEFDHLDYVLPIFFAGFLKTIELQKAVKIQDKVCLKLGVFGSIENYRRNYNGLFNAIKKMVVDLKDLRFRIYLVGKAPMWVQEEIKNFKLESVVEIYTEFVPFRKMFELLEEMDLVIFLIDNTVKNAKYYNRYKISGTSTLVKAFNKPIVSSSDYSVDDSLSGRVYFYKGTDIGSILQRINNGEITIADIHSKINDCYLEEKFSFAKQQAIFVSLIQRVVSTI